MIRNCYGIVLCGGKSVRMGTDKCFLSYSGQPQWHHLAQMLQNHCEKVFISCNVSQKDKFEGFTVLVDDPAFANAGPIASLLTAFAKFPGVDFFVVGCDYPFLSDAELKNFFSHLDMNNMASTFFNQRENIYEPVTGWYSHRCQPALMESFAQGRYSLQNLLRALNADKYIPADPECLISIDTPELMKKAMIQLKSGKHERS